MFIPLLIISAVQGQIVQFTAEVTKVYQHDPDDFSQGLIFESDDVVIESTGLYGYSKLQRIQLSTGEKLLVHDLPQEYFGEGVTSLDGKLYQLTWREQTMFVYDQESFELLETVELPLQITAGWGICTDGVSLYITDGSDHVFVLNPQNYTIDRTIDVIDTDGKAIKKINELEWIDGEVWANIWGGHHIARIDPLTGTVLYWIDLTGIEDAYETGEHWMLGNVLNGIAFIDDRILVTGKRWHKMFEIKLYTTQLLPHSPDL